MTLSTQPNKPATLTPERVSTVRTFIPAADVFETADEYRLHVDMPGVSDADLEVTLEKNVLTLRGGCPEPAHAGYKLAWSEYESGRYERTFALPDEIDRDHIAATLKNGVLELHLPKARFAKPRKIEIKSN